MANALALTPQTQQIDRMPDAETAWKPDLVRYRKWFNNYETNKSDELEEQQIARRYYNGKQWTDDEIKKLRRRGQAPVFDNRISRKIDFLVGVEQRMRRDPKAYPRGPNDEHSADVATGAVRYVCDINRWQQKASDAMHDGLVPGIGVVFIGVKNGRDGPDPEIKPVQMDRFFYDPRSVRPDFTDSRFLGLHLWMDVDEAKEKWPGMAAELEALIDTSNSELALVRADQDHAKSWANFEQRRIRVVEFWEKAMVDKPMSHDPQMMLQMQQFGMTPPPAEKVMGWRYCYFTGTAELECGVSPYLDADGVPDVPYLAWSPYVDEKGDRYGVIRNMKPMQDEVNHRRSKFLHLLSAKQIFTRKGDLDDPDETRRQLAKTDGVIEHNGEWNVTTGVIDHSMDIKGQAELLAQSQSSLENLGPNPGLIGKGGGVADQSGRAILAQRDSGMTELSPVFERNRDWKLRCYRAMWARIKQAWTAEKYIRVTDDPDAPSFLGLNQYGQHPQTGQMMSQNVVAEIDVDIIMEEGPDVVTMNEELMQTLAQIGANPAVPPKVLIELSNAPNKDKLFKLIDEASAPNPQIAAMQQRMGKLEELLAAAKVDSETAKVENLRADTVSKLAASFTPQAPQTNEFGQVTQAPSQPDFGQAFSVMQAFPLHYGQPTIEQMALMMGDQGQQPPDEQDQGQPGGQPPMPQPGQPMPQGMPPPDMPGGLPVDPQLGAM